MEYTVTYCDGSLVGWARSPRLAEELIAQDMRENDRQHDGYSVVCTFDDDEEGQR